MKTAIVNEQQPANKESYKMKRQQTQHDSLMNTLFGDYNAQATGSPDKYLPPREYARPTPFTQPVNSEVLNAIQNWGTDADNSGRGDLRRADSPNWVDLYGSPYKPYQHGYANIDERGNHIYRPSGGGETHYINRQTGVVQAGGANGPVIGHYDAYGVFHPASRGTGD